MSNETGQRPKLIIESVLQYYAISIWWLGLFGFLLLGTGCTLNLIFIVSYLVALLFAIFENGARTNLIITEREKASEDKDERAKRARFAANLHGVMFLLAMFASVIIYRMCMEQIL